MSEPAYTNLKNQIAQVAHRDDLSGQMNNFIKAAELLISARLGLVLEPLTSTSVDNTIVTNWPNLYVYASLISAYEFINEIDQANYYVGRLNEEIGMYYVTSPGTYTELVMGEPTDDGT